MKQPLKTKKNPRAAALAGRRPDAIDAEDVRFPLVNIAAVREALRHVFIEHKFTHLVCAAACGADLIALDLARELKIESHIILPFKPAIFRKISVVDRPGNWGKLYDQLIKKAREAKRLYLLGYLPNDEKAFSKTTQAIIDHTKALAKDSLAFGVVVWEGQRRGEDDATYEFATLSQEQGLRKLEVLTLQRPHSPTFSKSS